LDRARRIAQSITRASSKASALADIAKTLAITDPEDAAKIFTGAERIAQTIAGENQKSSTLTALVRALAASDSDHAEHIAQAIIQQIQKIQALVAIVET
jgi:hypothetical protein